MMKKNDRNIKKINKINYTFNDKNDNIYKIFAYINNNLFCIKLLTGNDSEELINQYSFFELKNSNNFFSTKNNLEEISK